MLYSNAIFIRQYALNQMKLNFYGPELSAQVHVANFISLVQRKLIR